MRNKTRKIKVGDVSIGGAAPVVVQSMTNTDTRDVEATVAQIKRLEDAGCEIARVAVVDEAAAKAIFDIKKGITIPLIADIHFDYKLALESLRSGADGLRINPGNIGSKSRVLEVAKAVLDKGAPIRVGSNSGSVLKKYLEKFGGPTPEALVESALEQVAILEEVGFTAIKISVKASSVLDTISAYRLISKRVDYPLHLGVTEAGTMLSGTVKSSLGIGMLLAEGIGDTIRISLTADPVIEVRVAYEMLSSLGLRKRITPELISCPTCGRMEYDLPGLVMRLEERMSSIKKPITVAVMGCVVNGPGEAKEADIGVAGGKGQGIIFRKGKIVAKCKESEIEKMLIDEIERFEV
ncbi:MAG: flavodoxin-dependent (E)-4-hydroxy-3-methylbut-2-enyl-diphosphate synthase [Pseudomonadota bacterium]